MEYGQFIQNGSQFEISTPKTPYRWYNYLFNQEYYMSLSQTGQGDSMCRVPDIRTFTRKYRYFYISDRRTGDCWSPNYRPCKVSLDHYRCVHALGWTCIESEYKGIFSSLRVFVPTKGIREIWTFTIKNKTQEIKELSAYSVFSFENGDPMGSKCTFDMERQILTSFTFPYHVYYEDKEKMDGRNSLIYMFSDRRADSWDCSETRFFGGEDTTEFPASIIRGRCSNMISEGDEPIGAFGHNLILQPGEEVSFSIVVGCAVNIEEASAIKETLLSSHAIEKEFEKVNKYWNEVSDRFKIHSPDENLNYFMNFWLKKQAVHMAVNNRLSVYCPVRNQLQDAMGYGMLDSEGAFELMLKVMAGQETSGYLQQWNMIDGSAPRGLCLLKHKDAPIWLVYCICTLINECGDVELLSTEVEFKDSSIKVSVYEHLLRAVYYLAGEKGQHGLILMGDGDWTDPINGAGRLGKGESTWSTLGLKYAISQLLPFCRSRNDNENVLRLEKISADLDSAVNEHCWDGEWYVAGFDDEGMPFGKSTDEEGRIFLNTQTWAVMSHTARGERLNKVLAAVDSLNTKCGPLLLAPEFSKWNKTWGRISIKLAGTTENGAVYCHASMFKAYADCVMGAGEKAYDTIRKTLPTNPDNPPEKNLQVPLFVPNYYFGLQDSPNFGHSSHLNATGTVPWMLWITLEHMLGAEATVNGLSIHPCIPSDWKEFSVERSFRKARYHIKVKNPDAVKTGIKETWVNGVKHFGEFLPYKEGEFYNVEVIMG